MSRTVYDLVREADWIQLQHEGFGATKKLTVRYTNRIYIAARTVDLPRDTSMLEIWLRACAMQRELLLEAKAVADVTKALTT